MRRVRHSRSGLFLIELMICILFFAFTAGICMRFFVKAHDMSTESRNLYQAQQEAASMAEVLESDCNLPDDMFVYYDKDWNQCDKKEKMYWMEVAELPQTENGQNKTGQDRSGQNKTEQDKTGQDKTEQDKSGQNKTEQDESGQTGEQQTETAEDIKKVKIAVYSGKKSQKKEIYHLNLSIYCPAYHETSHLSYGEYRVSRVDEMMQKGVI